MDLIPADNQGVFVLITVTVDPEDQQALVDTLCEAGDRADMPGLLSRKVLRSLDGKQVINHMQWASVEAYKAALAYVPQFKDHRAEVHRLMQKATSKIYEVADRA